MPENTAPYRIFASIYDSAMRNVPYGRWAEYLLERIYSYKQRVPRQLLDLGCGTGLLFAYMEGVLDFMGLDISPAMLEEASRNYPDAEFKEGSIAGPLPFASERFEWVICTHDSLNYLTEPEQLSGHFQEIHRILARDGIYSVDAVSLHNILQNHDRTKSVETLDGMKMERFSTYERKTQILRTFIDFTDEAGEFYKEIHEQRFHKSREIQQAAEKAGLRLLDLEGNYRRGPLREPYTVMNFHFQKSYPR